MLPMRAVILMGVCAPLAFISLSLGFMDLTYRLAVAGIILVFGLTLATPTRDGVWIGTHLFYRLAERLMPSAILQGRARRARIKVVGDSIRVSDVRGLYAPRSNRLAFAHHFADVPKVATAAPGLLHLTPGGARAILGVTGPPVAMGSEAYVRWCQQLIDWLFTIEVPVQFLTVVSHYDSQRAQMAFDRRTARWQRTYLSEMERELAGQVAQMSLGMRHFVIFAPGQAAGDGMPPGAKLLAAATAKQTSMVDAERVLQSATRQAESFGLEVFLPDRDDLAAITTNVITGASSAAVGDGVLHINDQHHVVMTVSKLPPRIQAGVIVDGLMRARTRGVASLHIYPVDPAVARKAIKRQTSMHRYAQSQGNDDIDTEVAIADAQSVLASIAQREIRPCRVALTMSVSHQEREHALEAAERLEGILIGDGFEVVTPSAPGFLPAQALCPGSVPLLRSLQMTTDSVAMRMLPALGTPFSDMGQPLVGINALNGAPAYLSVWTRPNHNAVIVGSSGAGKSVATKTMLVRHILEGVSAVVIDPDSEYMPLMAAVGGNYFELGTDALNPLAAGMGVPPDQAASLVIPILSVMGGDERGIKDGRPIRRLPDEDQGWLHAQTADFFRTWTSRFSNQEPVMHNLVEYLVKVSMAKVLTSTEGERCRIITSRLARFTQGKRAAVFDRPSTFQVGRRPVGIGLKTFAMSYGADLTPALAVILTNILAAIDRREGRMIIVVDEAHRVTSDPDAGEVLGQLVRQARKYGAGVWMCSQRIEDFVATELGKTLAATAATKLVLGTEEAALEDVKDVFKLQDEEVASVYPMVQGRGVLLSGGERTVVHVVPGPAIMSIANTSGALNIQAEADAEDRSSLPVDEARYDVR